eukprot:Skav214215  [mRNA]  locus=scaffold489:468127:471049:- [translate_table: standard]
MSVIRGHTWGLRSLRIPRAEIPPFTPVGREGLTIMDPPEPDPNAEPEPAAAVGTLSGDPWCGTAIGPWYLMVVLDGSDLPLVDCWFCYWF